MASPTTLVNGVLGDGCGEEEFLLDDESTISEQERHEERVFSGTSSELDDLAEDMRRPLDALLSREYLDSREDAVRGALHHCFGVAQLYPS